jgi:hypothetical protein
MLNREAKAARQLCIVFADSFQAGTHEKAIVAGFQFRSADRIPIVARQSRYSYG